MTSRVCALSLSLGLLFPPAPQAQSPDLVGMGDSDKLENSGPDRYTYREHREYLFALWDRLALGSNVTLVLHDWGAALGFDWARQNAGRVRGIVYMEAVVRPMAWADWPADSRRFHRELRTTPVLIFHPIPRGGMLESATVTLQSVSVSGSGTSARREALSAGNPDAGRQVEPGVAA